MSVTVQIVCRSSGSSPPEGSRKVDKARGLSLKGRTAQIVNGKLVLVESRSSPGDSGGEEAEIGGNEDGLEETHMAVEGPDAEDYQPVASTSRASTPSKSATSGSGNRSKLQRQQTRYFCTWEGCSKSYAKPVRLAEHVRSHTGERPFVCTHEGCNASYLRDTHLVAHMRTHLDENDKPFTCTNGDCGKTFWTNQHLNRHVKLVHDTDSGAYKCEQCDSAFNKHNKLREHIAKVHMPAGTKPFICAEEGCGKSFTTGSKLRTHAKVHDENRYVCMHPSHTLVSTLEEGNASGDDQSNEEPTSGIPHFATWSALQEHNKVAHPPACPYAECDGKVFKSNKKLRKHCVKYHLDTLPFSEEDSSSYAEEEEAEQEQEPEQTMLPIDNVGGTEVLAPEDAAQSVKHTSRTHATAREILEASARRRAQRQQKSKQSCSSSGRRDKKRAPDATLISTQPDEFQSFDGEGDYAEDGNETDGTSEAIAESPGPSKRVRFMC